MPGKGQDQQYRALEAATVTLRPHSDGRCVLCRTTRPSLDVYTKLAISLFPS